MSENRFIFHRLELAEELCNRLEGKGLFDASSGLFLAAPRRTGKSTFLREELVPAMKRRGWITIYVDLWSDQTRDPALLIADAIKETVETIGGKVKKAAKAVGLSKLTLGSFQFDLEKLGKAEGATLSDAFAYLAQKLKKPIALIVDEAQHALNTPAGINSMFSIKAARDRLNQGSVHPKLFLVMTGSHRDKLAHLVLKKDQPFFGSEITTFPLLGRGFTDAYTTWVNKQLSQKNRFSEEDVYQAFTMLGHRPELLKSVVKDVALEMGAASELGHILQKNAQAIRDRILAELESDVDGLTDLQKIVLTVLVKKDREFSPFSEESMKIYRTKLNDKSIGTQSIQAALEGLRAKNLIWKSARGSYALEDASLAPWLSEKL